MLFLCRGSRAAKFVLCRDIPALNDPLCRPPTCLTLTFPPKRGKEADFFSFLSAGFHEGGTTEVVSCLYYITCLVFRMNEFQSILGARFRDPPAGGEAVLSKSCCICFGRFLPYGHCAQSCKFPSSQAPPE